MGNVSQMSTHRGLIVSLATPKTSVEESGRFNLLVCRHGVWRDSGTGDLLPCETDGTLGKSSKTKGYKKMDYYSTIDERVRIWNNAVSDEIAKHKEDSEFRNFLMRMLL